MLQPPNVADMSSYRPPLDPIAPLRVALRAHYEIEREIGQGAYATVYLARDLKHERKVAIKVLNADPTSETGELRFIREIRTVAKLQHPNILPLHDSGHVEALLYYVMPYVSGETLRDRIDREKQLPADTACGIARDIADALAYAHAQGIIHRDIKPENILLSAGHPILADFGIARVIDLAGVRQLTRTGMGSPGTPAYMSPEQLLGDREIDARSDIYSLGCVLFEMLTGKQPFAGKEGFVKRFTEPPPNISAVRRDVSGWIDEVVIKALARNPAERYATAHEFVAALCGPVTGEVTPRSSLETREASRPWFRFAGESNVPESDVPQAIKRKAQDGSLSSRGQRQIASGPRRVWIARFGSQPYLVAAVGAVVFAAGIVLSSNIKPGVRRVFGVGTTLDTARYIILPLVTESPAIGIRVGDTVANHLYDAFSQWEGLALVTDTRVAQAISDKGSPPLTESEAVSMARELGAGKLIWGQASGRPGSTRARVHRYDVLANESKDEFPLVDSTSDGRVYGPATLRLLGSRQRPRRADGGDGRTRSFHAWEAYGRGHVALRNWDLPLAEREFRAALDADASYVPARLWLAQAMSWHPPRKSGEWVDEASRVAANLGSLDPRDQLVASGLSALADGRFPAACEAYTKVIRTDSLDFFGWYGLGECQAQDSVVVPLPSSPSRWAFRSSYYSAARAFLRALRQEPGAHTIFSAAKLQSLLPIASTKARRGVSVDGEHLSFAAFPTLEQGDTIGFIPYPMKMFATLPRGPRNDAALRKNTDALIGFATNWAKRFPTSAAAQEALAEAFEAGGDFGETSPRSSLALKAADSSIALSTDKRDVSRLRARKVRLYFKRGEFASAAVLADSVLRGEVDEPATSDESQWLAALTGRADLMAKHWLATLDTRTVSGGSIPPVVATRASKFYAHAALGVCGPVLTKAREQLDSALRNYVDSDIRKSVESDLTNRASSLAAPCTAGKSALRIQSPTDWLQNAQQAFARNDITATRAFLDAAAKIRQNKRPGDMSPDYIFQEAWLRTQLGDTAAAVAALDAELGTLPAFRPPAFSDAAAAASFGRAMALRADIAVKRREVTVARRWIAALASLWAFADPPLRSLVDRLRINTQVTSRQ